MLSASLNETFPSFLHSHCFDRYGQYLYLSLPGRFVVDPQREKTKGQSYHYIYSQQSNCNITSDIYTLKLCHLLDLVIMTTYNKTNCDILYKSVSTIIDKVINVICGLSLFIIVKN